MSLAFFHPKKISIDGLNAPIYFTLFQKDCRQMLMNLSQFRSKMSKFLLILVDFCDIFENERRFLWSAEVPTSIIDVCVGQ